MNFVVTEFAAVKRWPLYLYLIYRGNISFTLRKKKKETRFIVNLCPFRLNGSSVRKLITFYNNRTFLHYFQRILRAFDFRFGKKSSKVERMFVYTSILLK